MNIHLIHGSLIQRLGALEQKCFDRLCRGVPLLRPFVTALLLVRLGHAFYDYVCVSEQVLMIEDALARTRGEFARKPAAQIPNNRVQGEIDTPRGGGASGAATLEVINRIAVAHGIDLEEMQSGVRCALDDPMSSRQIQIAFRSSFNQLREFNQSLNHEASTLVTESLQMERSSSLVSPAIIAARICISVVTKTS